jgi:hypothetical protein
MSIDLNARNIYLASEGLTYDSKNLQTFRQIQRQKKKRKRPKTNGALSERKSNQIYRENNVFEETQVLRNHLPVTNVNPQRRHPSAIGIRNSAAMRQPL